MAEAIGLAASIGQLADLSLAIFKTMYQYAEEVKDARNRITTVATDLNHFREAMDAFQVVLLSSDISLAKMKPTWSDELKATIKFSRTILKALDAELDRICERPAKEKGTIRVTTVQRLKWPMVVKVIEKYRDDLMGMKTTLQMLNGTMVLATVTHLSVIISLYCSLPVFFINLHPPLLLYVAPSLHRFLVMFYSDSQQE